MSKIYNWKRFWCKRGSSINLSDGGFLYDPDSDYGKYFTEDVKPYYELANLPCLVLLGEPGIGKTYELEKGVDINKQVLKLSNDLYYYDKLNQYSDESRFINNVFYNSNFLKAKERKNPYLLMLDSLDECKIRIDTITEILATELKKNFWEGLFFRITCRTAEWSNYLESVLIDLYGENKLGIYELVPLRRKDVIHTLNENGIDETSFFEEIYLKAVQPLTIKPITLNFIVNIFLTNKTLPSSRKEIYEEGLKLLIDEQNPSRRESKLLKKYSLEEKLIAVQRIASIMILCNKSSICIERGDKNINETDIFIGEIIGGKEVIGKTEVTISEDLVKATLNT